MGNLSHLKDVLISKKKTKASSVFEVKYERHILVYFEGDMMARRDKCTILREKIWDWRKSLPNSGTIPGHRNDRHYDHLTLTILTGNEEHLQFYFDLEEALSSILIACKLPFIKTTDELDQHERVQ